MVVKPLVVKALVPLPDSLYSLARYQRASGAQGGRYVASLATNEAALCSLETQAMTSKHCSQEEMEEQRNNARPPQSVNPRRHSLAGSVPPLSCVRS